MATTTVIHFGEDGCFRLPVLQSAGYLVEECDSIEQFSTLLGWNPDAVLLEDRPIVPVVEARAIARTNSSTSLVLFQHDTSGLPDVGFDLVIPPLTLPEDWLDQIAALLVHSRLVRAQSQALQKQSASLRQNSAAVRQVSREIQHRSIRQRCHLLKHPWDTTEPPTD